MGDHWVGYATRLSSSTVCPMADGRVGLVGERSGLVGSLFHEPWSLRMAVDRQQGNTLIARAELGPRVGEDEDCATAGTFPLRGKAFLFPSRYSCTTISEPGHSWGNFTGGQGQEHSGRWWDLMTLNATKPMSYGPITERQEVVSEAGKSFETRWSSDMSQRVVAYVAALAAGST